MNIPKPGNNLVQQDLSFTVFFILKFYKNMIFTFKIICIFVPR